MARRASLEAAFVPLVSYGLRRGELLGLAWADFDPTARALAVRRSVKVRTASRQRDGNYPGGARKRLEVSELKTRRSWRILYLTPGIVEVLQEHAARQNEEQRASSQWQGQSVLGCARVVGVSAFQGQV
jgi:integrase